MWRRRNNMQLRYQNIEMKLRILKFTFVYHDEEHQYSLYFVCDLRHNGFERINYSLSGVCVHKKCSISFVV